MTESELKHRTKAFALAVLDFVEALPKSTVFDTLANQLIRSSSSVGANYRAACRAKSVNDMLAKLAICEEEADETGFWLELIASRHACTNKADALVLQKEASELTAILV